MWATSAVVCQCLIESGKLEADVAWRVLIENIARSRFTPWISDSASLCVSVREYMNRMPVVAVAEGGGGGRYPLWLRGFIYWHEPRYREKEHLSPAMNDGWPNKLVHWKRAVDGDGDTDHGIIELFHHLPTTTLWSFWV